MIHIRALRDKVALREAAPSILLVFNSFVWYIFTYTVFSGIVNGPSLLETEKWWLFAAYYVGVAVSAIVGAKFFPRARTRSLDVWLFMGAIATFLLTAVSSGGVLIGALLALFFGISLGIGLPSCLSYFADSTSVENRGFMSGIIWSTVGLTVVIFGLLINTLGQWEALVVLMIWRLFGGIGFLFLNRKHAKPVTEKSHSYFEVIRKRQILLYLFPWVLFSIMNFAEAPILEGVFGETSFAFAQFAEWGLVGIVAIIGGIIADITGRKRVVIAGFVMLGIEYAAMSVFYNSPAAWYLFVALDGITWGLLVTVFFTAIWGDLGENFEKEKYYTLGGLPYILSNFLYVLIKPSVGDISITAAFSFASFFLFLAVIPLMYAPETLPEKTIKDRELKNYLEKAQKVKEKYS